MADSRAERAKALEERMDKLFSQRKGAETNVRVRLNATISGLNRAYHDLTHRYYSDNNSTGKS